MNSLRARLALWFSASFLVVTTVFVLLTYQSLDLELRRKSWGSDFEMRPGWIIRGSSSEEEVREIMAGLIRESLTRSLRSCSSRCWWATGSPANRSGRLPA